MTKRRTPLPQLDNLLLDIKSCIEQERYILSVHAISRQNERDIKLVDVKYVLKTGYHEKKKTSFDEVYNSWKYAVRGRTLDDIEIRIIIAFEENIMHIITVMHVTKE